MKRGKENKLSRQEIHYWIHYGSLCLLAISLPSSRFMLSVSLELLVLNWLFSGGLGAKFKSFLEDRVSLAFTLIYISYLLWLPHTRDFSYALQNDLLHKLPTLLMPMVLATSPKLELGRVRSLFLLFTGSLLVVTLLGAGNRLLNPELSFREASPFMPGIYLGLMLVIAIYTLPGLSRRIGTKPWLFWTALALAAWFIFFLFYLRTLSALIAFAISSTWLVLAFIYRLRSMIVKLITIGVILFSVFLVLRPLQELIDQTQSENDQYSEAAIFSAEGNTYRHDTSSYLRENGYLVYMNIADQELAEAWRERSKLDYHGREARGFDLSYTLFRYMSSRGLRKDREGLDRMSDEDIRAVESGVTNCLEPVRMGLENRIYEELQGVYIYRASGHSKPTWSSFSMRIDLWKSSLVAFREKPLFGWGTGSILQATYHGFETYGSPLLGEEMKPHNQYIYILLTQGGVGLLLTILLYAYAIRMSAAWQNRPFRLFVLVMAVFCLANNPLESQTGQNIFVFFSLYYMILLPGAGYLGPNATRMSSG